jgi:hypothetical protein
MLALLARLPASLGHRRVALWAVVVVAATVALARTPLFGVLGYELALAMAGLGTVVGVDLGAATIRRRRRADRPGLAPALVEAVAVPVALMLAPLAMIATRGLWVRTCDPGFGLVAYASLALASTALAAGGAAAIALAVGPRRWLGPAAPYLGLTAVIVLGVHRFVTEPPVFVYSPVIGYFPGNLYDEDIRLGAALAWARLEQLAVIVAALAAVAARVDRARLAVRWRGPGLDRRAAAVAAAALVGALALRSQAGALGYAVDREDIAAALGGTVRTKHFVIHYDAAAPAIVADLALIAADHEFRLAQVCQTIGVDPAAIGTIRSFYFATADAKARWMGARHVEMAKPWLRQIYLTHEGFPHPSLRHELAHVVAGTFGDPWFGVAARRVVGLPLLVNPGLIEGLAVALDWPGGSRSMTPHQSMRAMELLGYAPSADDVFSVRFMTLSSARGYTAAGSFLRFLLDTYGPAPVRAVYRSGGDFAAAFGKSRSALVAEWRAMLATVEVPAAELELARERFRRGGVFARPCPHAIARREAEAMARLARGDRPGAIRLLRQVCRDAPEEPTYALTLAAVLSRGAPAEVAEGRATLERWSTAEHGAQVRASALDGLARLDGAAGDRAATRAHVAAALALPLDDERRRGFEAMALALDRGDLAAGFLAGYFFGTTGDDLAWATGAVALAPADGFARYLLGLQQLERGQAAAATASLSAALTLGLPSPRFVRNAARRLAVAAWRADDRAAVLAAAARLDATGHALDRALADDWRARAAAVTAR